MEQAIKDRAYQLKTDIQYFHEYHEKDHEQRARDKKFIRDDAMQLMTDAIDRAHMMQMDLEFVKAQLIQAEERINNCEEEIKKFTYERRKLNIGGTV